MQAEAILEQRSLELLLGKGRVSMLGVLAYIEEEVRSTRTGYTGLSHLGLWRKVVRDTPRLQQCLAQPSVFDSSTLLCPVTDDDLARDMWWVCTTQCRTLFTASNVQHSTSGAVTD